MRHLFIALLVICTLSVNAQMRILQSENNHSTVGFSISIAGFSAVTGKFGEYDIRLDWNDNDYTTTQISAEIQVSSINTGIPGRDDHLKTADFFNVEEFPVITFVSDSIQQVNFANFKAFGKFSMHGITKNVVLPFEIVKMDGNTIGIRSRTSLNRLDYGVGAEFKHTSLRDFLAPEIQVEIDFWTKKRKE